MPNDTNADRVRSHIAEKDSCERKRLLNCQQRSSVKKQKVSVPVFEKDALFAPDGVIQSFTASKTKKADLLHKRSQDRTELSYKKKDLKKVVDARTELRNLTVNSEVDSSEEKSTITCQGKEQHGQSSGYVSSVKTPTSETSISKDMRSQASDDLSAHGELSLNAPCVAGIDYDAVKTGKQFTEHAERPTATAAGNVTGMDNIKPALFLTSVNSAGASQITMGCIESDFETVVVKQEPVDNRSDSDSFSLPDEEWNEFNDFCDELKAFCDGAGYTDISNLEESDVKAEPQPSVKSEIENTNDQQFTSNISIPPPGSNEVIRCPFPRVTKLTDTDLTPASYGNVYSPISSASASPEPQLSTNKHGMKYLVSCSPISSPDDIGRMHDRVSVGSRAKEIACTESLSTQISPVPSAKVETASAIDPNSRGALRAPPSHRSSKTPVRFPCSDSPLLKSSGTDSRSVATTVHPPARTTVSNRRVSMNDSVSAESSSPVPIALSECLADTDLLTSGDVKSSSTGRHLHEQHNTVKLDTRRSAGEARNFYASTSSCSRESVSSLSTAPRQDLKRLTVPRRSMCTQTHIRTRNVGLQVGCPAYLKRKLEPRPPEQTNTTKHLHRSKHCSKKVEGSKDAANDVKHDISLQKKSVDAALSVSEPGNSSSRPVTPQNPGEWKQWKQMLDEKCDTVDSLLKSLTNKASHADGLSVAAVTLQRVREMTALNQTLIHGSAARFIEASLVAVRGILCTAFAVAEVDQSAIAKLSQHQRCRERSKTPRRSPTRIHHSHSRKVDEERGRRRSKSSRDSESPWIRLVTYGHKKRLLESTFGRRFLYNLKSTDQVHQILKISMARMAVSYKLVYRNKHLLKRTSVRDCFKLDGDPHNVMFTSIKCELISGLGRNLRDISSFQPEYLPLNPFCINLRDDMSDSEHQPPPLLISNSTGEASKLEAYFIDVIGPDNNYTEKLDDSKETATAVEEGEVLSDTEGDVKSAGGPVPFDAKRISDLIHRQTSAVSDQSKTSHGLARNEGETTLSNGLVPPDYQAMYRHSPAQGFSQQISPPRQYFNMYQQYYGYQYPSHYAVPPALRSHHLARHSSGVSHASEPNVSGDTADGSKVPSVQRSSVKHAHGWPGGEMPLPVKNAVEGSPHKRVLHMIELVKNGIELVNNRNNADIVEKVVEPTATTSQPFPMPCSHREGTVQRTLPNLDDAEVINSPESLLDDVLSANNPNSTKSEDQIIPESEATAVAIKQDPLMSDLDLSSKMHGRSPSALSDASFELMDMACVGGMGASVGYSVTSCVPLANDVKPEPAPCVQSKYAADDDRCFLPKHPKQLNEKNSSCLNPDVSINVSKTGSSLSDDVDRVSPKSSISQLQNSARILYKLKSCRVVLHDCMLPIVGSHSGSDAPTMASTSPEGELPVSKQANYSTAQEKPFIGDDQETTQLVVAPTGTHDGGLGETNSADNVAGKNDLDPITETVESILSKAEDTFLEIEQLLQDSSDDDTLASAETVVRSPSLAFENEISGENPSINPMETNMRGCCVSLSRIRVGCVELEEPIPTSSSAACVPGTSSRTETIKDRDGTPPIVPSDMLSSVRNSVCSKTIVDDSVANLRLAVDTAKLATDETTVVNRPLPCVSAADAKSANVFHSRSSKGFTELCRTSSHSDCIKLHLSLTTEEHDDPMKDGCSNRLSEVGDGDTPIIGGANSLAQTETLLSISSSTTSSASTCTPVGSVPVQPSRHVSQIGTGSCISGNEHLPYANRWENIVLAGELVPVGVCSASEEQRIGRGEPIPDIAKSVCGVVDVYSSDAKAAVSGTNVNLPVLGSTTFDLVSSKSSALSNSPPCQTLASACLFAEESSASDLRCMDMELSDNQKSECTPYSAELSDGVGCGVNMPVDAGNTVHVSSQATLGKVCDAVSEPDADIHAPIPFLDSPTDDPAEAHRMVALRFLSSPNVVVDGGEDAEMSRVRPLRVLCELVLSVRHRDAQDVGSTPDIDGGQSPVEFDDSDASVGTWNTISVLSISDGEDTDVSPECGDTCALVDTGDHRTNTFKCHRKSVQDSSLDTSKCGTPLNGPDSSEPEGSRDPGSTSFPVDGKHDAGNSLKERLAVASAYSARFQAEDTSPDRLAAYLPAVRSTRRVDNDISRRSRFRGRVRYCREHYHRYNDFHDTHRSRRSPSPDYMPSRLCKACREDVDDTTHGRPANDRRNSTVRPADDHRTATVHPVDDHRTATVHPVDDRRTATVHPVDDRRTATVHPTDDRRTAAVTVHPTDDRRTAAATVHPTDDRRTAASTVHPTDDRRTAASTVHPSDACRPDTVRSAALRPAAAKVHSTVLRLNAVPQRPLSRADDFDTPEQHAGNRDMIDTEFLGPVCRWCEELVHNLKAHEARCPQRPSAAWTCRYCRKVCTLSHDAHNAICTGTTASSGSPRGVLDDIVGPARWPLPLALLNEASLVAGAERRPRKSTWFCRHCDAELRPRRPHRCTAWMPHGYDAHADRYNWLDGYDYRHRYYR